MKAPKYISFDLLDSVLKDLLTGVDKPHPVNYSYVSAGTNPNNYGYVIVIDACPQQYNIYYWVNSSWQLVGADDKSIPWSEVTDKPLTFPPETHDHSGLYITEADVEVLLQSKADLAHTHDALYAALGHNHDATYYTESEVNTLLLGKSDTNHGHTTFYTKSEADVLLAAKASSTHGHPTEFAMVTDHETRLDVIEGGYSSGHAHANLTVLNDIAAGDLTNWDTAYTDRPTIEERVLWNTVSTHDHDARYYTETEINNLLSSKADTTTTNSLQTQINGKADTATLSGHTGNSTIHVTQTDKDTWNAHTKVTVGTVAPSTGMWFEEV